jgi:hypothetical protein
MLCLCYGLPNEVKGTGESAELVSLPPLGEWNCCQRFELPLALCLGFCRVARFAMVKGFTSVIWFPPIPSEEKSRHLIHVSKGVDYKYGVISGKRSLLKDAIFFGPRFTNSKSARNDLGKFHIGQHGELDGFQSL